MIYNRVLFSALAFAVAFVAMPVSMAFSQTSADELYFAVQRAQASLGMGQDSDRVRDNLLIRELETESAKGFSADLNVLHQAVNNFGSAGDLSVELKAVKSALAAHLASLNQATSIDTSSKISGLNTELEPIELSTLEETRDTTLGVLESLDEFHESELSIYGRHYLNKRLKLKQLKSSLADFDFTIAPINDEDTMPEDDESEDDYNERIEKLEQDIQNRFNREINGLRNELATARKIFGAATFTYPNMYLARSERQITSMEDQVGGYLLSQSRRKASFEEQLQVRKQAFLSKDGTVNDSNDRLFQAELGRWLNLLNQRGQSDGLESAVRSQFSKPNLKITVQESLVNRLASQSVSQMDHLDEVIVGSRAQGWSYTTGSVSLDFVNSPHSALVRINLSGSIQSSAYTKEGPVTAYTSSAGSYSASRDVKANIGNLSIYGPQANANVSSTFQGTNCLPLVTRIAANRFNERQMRAEEVASERARDRVLDQFTAQTDEALDQGVSSLMDVRSREGEMAETANNLRRDVSELLAEDKEGETKKPFDLIDPFLMPRIFVTTTDTTLEIGGLLEANNRLAAGSDAPATTVPCDVRIQIHESMVSNLIAPFVQDRLIENWQFRNTIEALASRDVNFPEEDEDRPFAIRFEDGRPIQIEFDNQEIGLTIFGKEFRQGRNSYTDPLSIKVRARIIRHDGQLKLSRTSRVQTEFTYEPLEDKNFDVTFRSFLQDNLDAAIGDIETPEEAIPLPEDLLFVLDMIEDEDAREQLKRMKLVECSSDNGWLTLGWNYAQGDGLGYMTNTPAIWTDLSMYEKPEQPADESLDSDGDSKPADGDDQPSLDLDDDSK